MKFTKEEIGFNKNHAMIMGVVVFALAGYALPKAGLNVKAMFGGNQPVHIMTYDDARAKVIADLGDIGPNDYTKTKDQIALIDRGTLDTQVLGDAIGVGTIPNAKDMQLPELDQQFPLTVTEAEGNEAEASYHTAVSDIESKYGVIDMLAVLNTSNTEELKQSTMQWRQMLRELASVPVPKKMQASHHARLGYYYSLMKTGEVYAGISSESELPLYVKAMLAFSSSMDDEN